MEVKSNKERTEYRQSAWGKFMGLLRQRSETPKVEKPVKLNRAQERTRAMEKAQQLTEDTKVTPQTPTAPITSDKPKVSPQGEPVAKAPSTVAEKIADNEGFDRRLINAIIQKESSGRSGVVNTKSGAKGLVQIHNKTVARSIAKLSPNKFKGNTIEEKAQSILDNDEDNITAGIVLFKDDQARYEKQGVDKPLMFAMAKYNSTTKAFEGARKKANNPNSFEEVYPFLPKETKDYVDELKKQGVLDGK